MGRVKHPLRITLILQIKTWAYLIQGYSEKRISVTLLVMMQFVYFYACTAKAYNHTTEAVAVTFK